MYGTGPPPAIAENPVYRRYDPQRISGTIEPLEDRFFTDFNTVNTQGHGFAQMWLRIKVISMTAGGSLRFQNRMQAVLLGFRARLEGDPEFVDVLAPGTHDFEVLTAPFLVATAVAPVLRVQHLGGPAVEFRATVEGVIGLGTYPMDPYRELESSGRPPKRFNPDPVLRRTS